ncbi:hypothetical protein [uncultured Draconibacterium sp.]|mgnify:CR=1 FL=1|uniref:hypothetical protein n=1 Tax=uncultured Draconibacterium sp. TaxID=1573823 RepID=UPI0025E16E11|nr:hypothetical protein [uncultured Draconibacterium sp.]
MKKVTFLLVGIFVFGVSNLVKAQDNDKANHAVKVTVPTVNLVDIEDEKGDNAGTAEWEWTDDMFGTEAGDFNLEPLEVEETFYLQYTSIRAKGKTNKITAGLTVNDIPAAISLQVKVEKNASASKKGSTGEGNAAFETIPTSGSINVVTGIKTGYTGTDKTNGHKLNYQLVIDPTHNDFGDMEADVYDATITYTIIEE